jgi:TIR domain
MADIFLSYANRDVNRIKILVEVLTGQGWTVWWDHKIRIGKTFDQVIEEEIAKAKCVVVLWSKESIVSDWVKAEAAEGRKRQILAPALIDDVTIPLEFRRIETARLHDWKELDHPELDLLLFLMKTNLVADPTQRRVSNFSAIYARCGRFHQGNEKRLCFDITQRFGRDFASTECIGRERTRWIATVAANRHSVEYARDAFARQTFCWNR